MRLLSICLLVGELIFPAYIPTYAYPKVRHETMTAFLELLQDKYGGVDTYVKNYLGLSDDDVCKIQENILVSSSSHL